MWPAEGASLSSPEGGPGMGVGWLRHPRPRLAVMMKSLVQPEEGQSGGGRPGTPLKGAASAHGHEEGTAVVRPTGTGGSDPHSGRCEGRAQRPMPGGVRGSVPTGSAPWQVSGSSGSRERKAPKAVGGPRGARSACGWQASVPAAGEVQGGTACGPGVAWAYRLGRRCPPGPGHCSLSARAWPPGQPDPGKAGPAAGQHEGPVRRCPWRS